MASELITTLIVDDELDVRLLTRMILESGDSRCIVVGEAASGREAIERYSELMPDCVVLDILMPEMDGIETARLIRAINRTQRIVFCTAHRPEEPFPLHDYEGCVPKDLIERLPQTIAALMAAEVEGVQVPCLADAVDLRGASSSRSGQNGGS